MNIPGFTAEASICSWEKLTSQEIRLVVCSAIRRKINRRKLSSKNRLSERARKWSPEFKKLLRPGTIPLILKHASARASVKVASSPRLDVATDSWTTARGGES